MVNDTICNTNRLLLGEIGRIYTHENFDTPLYTPSFFAGRISNLTFWLVSTPPPPVRRHHQIAASGRDP